MATMTRPVRMLVTIYAVCDRCGPNAEHGYCASEGAYKCRACGQLNRVAGRPSPSGDKLDLRGAPLLDALDNLQRQARERI
ncbi:MAG: hypothetical protein HY943_18000 [Gammaproteobacteria bacterium]|nr:hypothetical protein [Gammaproteobacteria bacterium]